MMGQLKAQAEVWWPRIQFLISNFKSLVIGGAVIWAIIILSLDLVGLVDVKTECPLCARVIESVIPDANASTAPIGLRDEALLRLNVVILPQ